MRLHKTLKSNSLVPINQTKGSVVKQSPEGAAGAAQKRAQMADVARLAGVSVATVSRALAGSTLIREDTRNRIREIATSMNYAINDRAQNLRLQSNRTVGLVVPFSTGSRQHLTDPFFLSIVGMIADELTDVGFDVLLSRIDSEQLEQCAQLFNSGRVVGLIVIGQWHRHEQLNRLALRGVPLVVWGALLDAQSYCSVGSDNEDGGKQATAHLLDQGCKRILFLGDPQLPEVAQRLKGYEATLARQGIAVDDRLILDVPFAAELARSRIERRIARGGFDGVFACSDLLGIAACNVLQQAGHRVPQDVPVVGFDDVSVARYIHPTLSTVHQPLEQAAREMVAALQRIAQGERVTPIQLKANLVVRETSRQSALR
jgi:DNA-binding LacI/PurR family transcriptional regulator